MWSMYKYFLALIFFVSISTFSNAQEDYFDSLLIEEIRVGNPVFKPVLGLGMGVFNFFGDVNDNFRNFSTGKPGYHFTVSSYIDKKHQWKAEFFILGGSVTGNERTTERNLNFYSKLLSLGGKIHYDFMPLVDLKKVAVSPYVEAGIGTLQFGAKGDLTDQNGNLYTYAPDGTIRNHMDEIAGRDYTYESDLRELDLYGQGKYSQFGVMFPVGIGFTASLSKRVSVRMGATFNFTTTDLIDNVSSKSSGVESNNRPDFFSYSFVSIRLDLFSQPEFKKVDLMYADFEQDDILVGDEDNDWVLDMADECPHTPLGVEVDSLGCPLDEDRDGVPDYIDKEGNTPFNAFVDEQGQQIPDSVLIEMLKPGEAIDRADLDYYLLMAREQDEKIISRPTGVPVKFKEFDLDNDDYLSFEELLGGITRFFDFKTFLSLKDIYEMMEFYFLQE